MAKGKELSIAQKQIIIYLYIKGHSVKDICGVMDRCRQTVEMVIKRATMQRRIVNKPRQERPKSLSSEEENLIFKLKRENPNISAPKINEQLRKQLKTNVCDETIRKLLRAKITIKKEDA